jgi:type IV pilus biogenesis protein CpaD/CtpE
MKTPHPRSTPARHAAALAALLAATLAGCASAPSADPVAAAQAAVQQRAQQRADAIVREDAAAAYAFAAPSYRRLVTPQTYAVRMAAMPVRWLQARVHQVTCPLDDGATTPQRCTVQLEVTSQPRLPLPAGLRAPFTGMVQQTWVQADGQWWLLDEL